MMPGDTGQRYDDEEFVEAIVAKGDSWVSTGAIARQVGCTRNTATRRLEMLVDDGDVEKLSIGDNTHAWQVASDG